ncbi:ABC transporter ATP-binding protein [Paracoccus litorisediminis]|jgi:sulfonate transport system ATP-binding protein|uniref:ATP-binding cassette domain-containing protein n=1 Tax=Paracoccus litorisediminis TaxID=2006130 RepID=A0A844HIU1_9RHOB|nr:ABC transporter ATP-binding protein [Paracoccus litorisediminis]MTH60083.1 ATP-binding cassette domain-containing protein [Paracoccus litorisediminis]
MQAVELLPRDITVPPMLRDNRGAAVSIRNVTRSFEGNRVLSNLDLDVRPGEFLSIVGKSGCGKSTLLRLIAGLDQPSSGEVRIDDRPATQAGDKLRIMFQEPRLLPWANVADNVAVGLRQGPDPQAVTEALASVQLADKAGVWPALLSGGQRQRAALARALVSHPSLLVLDEPLGALDALTRLTMQNLIRDMHAKAGFTAILVTHDVAEAVALSDRVIVLGQGGILHHVEILRVGPTQRGSAELAAIEAEILDAIFAA